jgi:ribonuclease HI
LSTDLVKQKVDELLDVGTQWSNLMEQFATLAKAHNLGEARKVLAEAEKLKERCDVLANELKHLNRKDIP